MVVAGAFMVAAEVSTAAALVAETAAEVSLVEATAGEGIAGASPGVVTTGAHSAAIVEGMAGLTASKAAATTAACVADLWATPAVTVPGAQKAEGSATPLPDGTRLHADPMHPA